jgi:hypothetical protein
MSKCIFVLAALVVLLGMRTAEAVVTVVFDNGTINSTTALTGFSTYGDMMDGMVVTAFFANSTSETLAWADTGLGSGGVTSGADWSLSESGDTFNSNWTLANHSSQTMTRLLIDAGPGNSVFDTQAIGDVGGTAGSERGWNFEVTNAYSSDITATYRDAVALTGDAPVGDLFRFLDVEFQGNGFVRNSWLTFRADTDNILFAGDINPVVPEPASLAIWSLLGGVGIAVGQWRRRRRA